MEPSIYVPAYLERAYLAEHPELTPAARDLLHDEVQLHPEHYATTDHARALLSYQQVHDNLIRELDRMEDLTDEEFEERGGQLSQETRVELHAIWRADDLCIDAQLVDIQLSDASLDSQLNDMMKLEQHARSHLVRTAQGFDPELPGYWNAALLPEGVSPAEATYTNPVAVGWLHTLEALSQTCIASARYRPACRYARMVMQAQGYPNRAVGTLLLALARLEDEDAFFEAAREGNCDTEDSPWFLLGRTLLLYKVGRRRNAQRALRDFATRCDGGAFFLLNPTFLTPYLPVRPEPREGWQLSHQAVWEADGIIVDTPDFATWAASVDGISALSERFAQRNGF